MGFLSQQKMKIILYHRSEMGTECTLQAPMGISGVQWNQDWIVVHMRGSVLDVYSGKPTDAFRMFLEITGCTLYEGGIHDAIILDNNAFNILLSQYRGR
ncbi:hypothetical protein [Thermoflexus sp.]|uniref:hypothetical protein n=1 Tax=Thermoflexus sp. TaxID=1969742 RepID=UPI002ADE6E0F|nr:hypothetical protein [Thermoflexus sp.]